MKKNLIFTFVCGLLLSLLLSACNNNPQIIKESKENQLDDEKAILSFSLKTSRYQFGPDDVKETDINMVQLTYEEVNNNESFEKNWTSIDEFEAAQIELDAGTYNFYVNLFAAGLSSENRLVQSGKIENKEIVIGSNSCSFNTSYVDSGDFSITYEWLADSDGVNRIGSLKMGLYSLEDSKNALEGYELSEVIFEKDSANENAYSAVYSGSDIPNGTYKLKIELYDNDESPSLLNTYDDYIKIYGYKTIGSRSFEDCGYNKNYFITYELNGGSEVCEEGIESNFVRKHNAHTTVNLPGASDIEKEGYVFDGWYTSSSFEEGSEIEVISLSSEYIQKDLTLYAKWTSSSSGSSTSTSSKQNLYVSSSGSSSNDGLSETSALDSIDSACQVIINTAEENSEWVINVSGSLSSLQTIPESLTSAQAKSIEIIGMNGLDSDSLPQDAIDREQEPTTNSVTDGNALIVNSQVPVTITNLKITRAVQSPAVVISQGATLKLGDGVVITKNYISSNGKGTVHNEGTLFMYGSAVIGNKDATAFAYGSSSTSLITDETNANYSAAGGAIYNGCKEYGGGEAESLVSAKVYLGYDGFDEDGSLHQATLTGGLYGNASSTGGAIYNCAGSYVYMDSGNIQWNAASSGGGAIYNADQDSVTIDGSPQTISGGIVEISGGKIINNRAYQSGNYDSAGGALYNAGQTSKIVMSGGTITKNEAYTNGTGQTTGGALYNGGLFFMYGSAVIGDENAKALANSSDYGNLAQLGAAIYNYGAGSYTTKKQGNIYIGYKPASDGTSPEEADFTGGIYHNYAPLSTNSSISSDNYGGAAIYNYGGNTNGNFKIRAGTIAYNYTEKQGGAIWHYQSVGNGPVPEISGGTIKENGAGENGGAIYLKNTGKKSLTLKDSIFISSEEGHDIYLPASTTSYYPYLEIAGELIKHNSSDKKINLSTALYDTSMTLLTFTETSLSSECGKFALASTTDDDGNTINWAIDENGKLVQVE
ncbi:MAG: InlB B-repeat-containing protein [Treponema sp.]|nr:InlB B-repeat-containing protein [Treponema sp.]